jgi:hypothetical protein
MKKTIVSVIVLHADALDGEDVVRAVEHQLNREYYDDEANDKIAKIIIGRTATVEGELAPGESAVDRKRRKLAKMRKALERLERDAL